MEGQETRSTSFHEPPPAGGFGAGPGPGHFGPILPERASDRLAVIALALGVFSIPGTLCCLLGIPLGIGAICMSIHAQRKIAIAPHLHHGSRMATGGFYCGLLGLLLTALYVGLNLLLPLILRR